MNQSKVEKLNFHSTILGKAMSMLVYLPENYNNPAPLPVVYFLHGRSGDEQIMVEAEINITADKMIKAKKITPLLIVCPRIENSRGLNSSTSCKEVYDPNNRIINLGMYEDYLIKEVIPLTDKTFNTIKSREGRFIGGASAGGHAALHNAFRHQEMFSKAGGHMPAVELKLEEEDKAYYEDIHAWTKYDPVSIIKNDTSFFNMKVYLDAGNKDEGKFYEGCSILHKALIKKGIDSQNHVFPGHHNMEYIRSNMEKYLQFYGS